MPNIESGPLTPREEAFKHALDIAFQSILTEVYLNPEHEQLHQDWSDEKIDAKKLIEGTYHILNQLKLEEPQRLKQINQEQEKKIQRLNKGFNEPVDFISLVDE